MLQDVKYLGIDTYRYVLLYHEMTPGLMGNDCKMRGIISRWDYPTLYISSSKL